MTYAGILRAETYDYDGQINWRLLATTTIAASIPNITVAANMQRGVRLWTVHFFFVENGCRQHPDQLTGHPLRWPVPAVFLPSMESFLFSFLFYLPVSTLGLLLNFRMNGYDNWLMFMGAIMIF